jgi:predicted TIM-barrel fold metal-dependent hydrolase
MHDGIEIIDAQVHSWEHLTKSHWSAAYRGANQESFPIETMLAAMDAVGVDAAILDALSDDPSGTWRDNSYAETAALRFPERIASVVRGVDFADPDIEERVAAVRSRPGVLGIRISAATDDQERVLSGASYERFLAAAQKHNIPLLMYISGRLHLVEKVAREYPDTTVLIVHMGLPQPPRPIDNPPFKRFAELLNLAKYPNVTVELIGAPALSQEEYPFVDLWPNLNRLFEAYTLDRVAWGTDFTRFWGLHTYAELLGYIWHTSKLDKSEKGKLFGGTLRQALRWQPAIAQVS